MKTKLTSLLAITLLLIVGLNIHPGLITSGAAPPIPPSAQIRMNIQAMLQQKAAIKPLPDIPGGARTATNRDAAYFAWQEFIALSWANVAVTGQASVSGPGAREFADVSKKFGQPAVGSSVAYPALVWESTRHRSEIYTGTSTAPNGYQSSAAVSWGYNSTPGYVYPAEGSITAASGPSNCKTINPSLTPFVNLDEGSQIGVCTMYSGTPYSNSSPKNDVLFLAKANYMEYGYIASRGWFNTALVKKPSSPGTPTNPVASSANTSGYILTKSQLPPAGTLNGSTSAGSYVSFPNGTLEFKAAFRVATDEERTAYENGQPIPGGYHVAPIRYYQDSGNNQFEYVDTCGVLLSLHIIHKTPSAPYFIFATFEHKDDIIGTDGNAVEDADGNLNPNAFTSTAPPAPPAGYVVPSSGTAPAGQYLVPPTSPNVSEIPSQYSNNSVSVQNFVPSPTTNAGAISTTQSSYQNTRDGSTSTLPSANSPSATDSYLTVNRRRFSIPQNPIIQVNQDVHKLIAQFGYNTTNNVWLNYKLVNVQWVPAGNANQKTPGKIYGDTSGGANPSIAVESFYLSNSLVETNLILSAFSGQFGPFVSGTYDGFSITDFYYNKTQYTNNNINVGKKPQTTTRNVGDPFYNVYATGGPYNMGGCMGCHGNAAVAGFDNSFILKGAPFKIEGVEPTAAKMIERHKSYFKLE